MTNLVPFTEAQASILIESRETHDANTRKLAACERDFIRQGLGLLTVPEKRENAERILVLYWQGRVAADGKDASVRALFNQMGKEVYEYGVAVQGDKVVQVASRNRESCPLKALADEIKSLGKGMSADEKAKLAEQLRKLLSGDA